MSSLCTTRTGTAAIARGRAVADARRHGAAPAPYAALELMAAALDRPIEESAAAEVEALVELMMGDEFRAGVYAFDLVQRRAKKPAGVPDRGLARTVDKVGIVGAGLMAGQLALLFARRLLVPVVLTDLDQERVDRGIAYVHGEIAKLEQKGRVNPDLANRLRGLVTGSVDQQVFADADFVVEAVFEDLAVKQEVFADAREDHQRDVRAGDEHLVACRSPRWRPVSSTRNAWSASTSSTRWRCCRCWRSSAASRPTTRRSPPRSRSARAFASRACW